MHNKLWRGFSSIHPRLILVVIVLFVIPFIQCSKGSGVISPIMPSGEYQSDTGPSDTYFIDPGLATREVGIENNSSITPVMCANVLDDLIEKLDSKIGERTKLENQLVFLDSGTDTREETNPPLFHFAFAAPHRTVSPDDITITMDGANISEFVKYSYISRESRNIDFYVGTYKPSEYLNPEIQHNCGINISPVEGDTFSREFPFSVQQPDNFRIDHAGFILKDKSDDVYLDRLKVFVESKDTTNIREKFLEKERWILTNKSDKQLPEIDSVKLIHSGVYIIKLTDELDSFSKFDLSIDLSDGVRCAGYEIISPAKQPERGGDVYREAATYPPCPRGCRGILTADAGEEDVQGCEDYHSWVITATCNAPCYKQIRKSSTVKTYSFSACDYTANYLSSIFCVDTYEDDIEDSFECYATLNESECSEKDIISKYVMFGYTDSPPESVECGTISNTVIVEKHSDTEPPEIQNAMFLEHETTIDPNCQDACCRTFAYRLTFDATDDKCLNFWNVYLILFRNGADPEYISPAYIGGAIWNQNKYMKKTYEFNSPNIFACVEKLRIVVHDKKGNWVAKDIEPQEASSTFRDPDRLPYPHTLELSFGDRAIPDPENPLDHRQWVNLERNFDNEFDTEVCVRKIDHPENGDQIYNEVTVTPPIYGVNVLVEYEDPEFRSGSKNSPTNTVDDPFNIATDKLTPSYNGSLTLEEYKLMWGSHPPYPFWEPDGRTLGDNYNFYYTTLNQLENQDIPEWDPIRAFHHHPDIPCFEKPACSGLPLEEFCEDYFCSKGQIIISTNILGKAAVYLNTYGHGGDNFKIKACGYYDGDKADCLTALRDEIFTLWRKITVDFAWMEPRNEPNTNCGTDYKDYNDYRNYKVNENMTIWIDGAYDDAFIEIVRGRDLGPNDYYMYFPNLHYYADNMTTFHEPDYDTIELLGCDHDDEFCASGLQGQTVELIEPPEMHWHSFVFVGNIFDCLHNRWPKYPANYSFFIDGSYQDNLSYISGVVATHEILHLLTNCNNEIHAETFYGVNRAGMDQRSYMHHNHIMGLRHGVQGLYYGNDNQECYNTAGITYFDLAFDGQIP
jgi:hypothetical protein